MATKEAEWEKEREELYAEIGRLSTQLSWLKKNLVECLSHEQRRQLLDWTREELPISMQAPLLSLSRSGLYYQPVAPSAKEVALKHRIDEIYTAHPYYGSRRISAQLAREGQEVNRKAVVHHMQEMGLAALYPGPNLSKRALKAAVFPYLLKGVQANYPNHIWGIDVCHVGADEIPVETGEGESKPL